MVHLLGFILVFHAFDDLLHAVADARMRYGVGAPVTGTPLRFRIDFVVAVLSESATLAFFIPVTVLAVFRFIRRILDLTHVSAPPFPAPAIPL